MLAEVDVAGVYVAPIVIYALAAIVLFVPLRFLLGRSGLLRLPWHPALFELALFVSIVSLLVLLA